jgi:hypothetical protein
MYVKSKLENELGYATLEMNDDVVGLLRQLKQMAFASGGGSTSILDTPDCFATSTSCWTNMRTRTKRTRGTENPDAFIRLNTECV